MTYPGCVLVQKYRTEVGTQAMDHLINILQTDRYVHVSLFIGKTFPVCCSVKVNSALLYSQSSC